MKRIMKFAALAFLVSSYPALAEEGNGADYGFCVESSGYSAQPT